MKKKYIEHRSIRNLTMKAKKDILKLDEKYIGTYNYMGFAYFWNKRYKWIMREQTSYRCRLIHKKLLENGLNPSGCSQKHEYIIYRYVKGVI